MARLSRIVLDNFLSFGHIEFDLRGRDGPCGYALVYGENGSGKTNLAMAVRFLRDSMFTAVDTDTVRSLRMAGSDGPMGLRYEFEAGEERLSYTLVFDSQGLLAREELARFTAGSRTARLFEIESAPGGPVARFGRAVFSPKLSRTLRRSIAASWGGSTLMAMLLSETLGDDPDSTGVSVTAPVRATIDFIRGLSVDVGPDQGMWPDGMSVESGVIEPSDAQRLDAYGRAASAYLVRLFSDIKGAGYETCENDGGLGYRLVVDKVIAGRRRKVPIESESAGTRRLLGMLPALLGFATGGVSVIDGFDSGVHDRTIQDMFGEVVGGIRGQLIIMTHDTLLLETADPANVYVIRTSVEGHKEIRTFDSIARTRRGHHNNRQRYLQGLYDGIPITRSLDLGSIARRLDGDPDGSSTLNPQEPK